jgi:1-pyrroline-5-carboxylate dehydrogenase
MAAQYHASNEPICMYNPGTKERAELDATLERYNSQVFEIPVVVGDEEIRTGTKHVQPKPFNHKSPIAMYYQADAKTLEKAIDASQKALRSWDLTPLEKRAEIFIRAAELIRGKYRYEMLAATMLGQAKTIFQAEIDAVCELSDFYAFNVQWALEAQNWKPTSSDKISNSMVWRGLEGFWAAVAPFNFTAISGHLAGAPALMGNVVLWKPSHSAVLSSYLTFKILREAGVPPGVINFVPSRGPVFGDAITKSPYLAGVNFTGGADTFYSIWTDVGKNIATCRNFPRLIGECGGKNFHFIHPSADIVSAVNHTVRSAFEYTGQKCSACSRLYVPTSRWTDFRNLLVSALRNVKVGSPLDPASFLSAVIDERSFKKIKGYIDKAKSSPECSFVFGGNCDDSTGYYIEPTVILTKDPRNFLMEEEIFGPVLTVYVYPDADCNATLQLVDNTSPYALTGSLFATDDNFIHEAQKVLRFSTGNLYINDKSTGAVVSQQPFGGARKSGTNDKAGSPFYLQRFVNLQAVKVQSEPLSDWTYSKK